MCRFRERFLLLDGLATAQALRVTRGSFDVNPCSLWEAVSVAIAHPLGVDPGCLRKISLG